MPDLLEMKCAGEMYVHCNPCRQVFMPYESCPKCGAKLEKEVKKPTPINVRELCLNPEPWEVEVARIGEAEAKAVEERAKHVKIVIKSESEEEEENSEVESEEEDDESGTDYDSVASDKGRGPKKLTDAEIVTQMMNPTHGMEGFIGGSICFVLFRF